MDIDWTHEAGSFELNGYTYAVGRDGWASGAFYVRVEDLVVARAVKPSAFKRRFEIEFEQRQLTLAAASWPGSTFQLTEGDTVLGGIRRGSWWKRGAIATLPDEFPSEVQVFILWLVHVMWKRAEDSD